MTSLRHLSILMAMMSALALLTSCEQSDLSDDGRPPIAFFADGVTFDGGPFLDYKCPNRAYSIQPSCFEVIGNKWYALEYTSFVGGTDVNLVVNGEQKATILSNCSSVQNVVAYQKNGRFKAYIFYFDADDHYHGVHYDDGELEEIEGLSDFERILLLRTVKNDVYAVWNMDVTNFYEVGNIVITKNGKPVKQSLSLPSHSSVMYFRDLYIDGSTIYSFLTLRNQRGEDQAYYAKDNALVKMSGLDDVCFGQVVGGRVHALGMVKDGGWQSRYWEGGKTTKILPDSAPVSPRGLVVDGGSVYYLVTDCSSIPVSVFFKDGVEYTRKEGELFGFKFIGRKR